MWDFDFEQDIALMDFCSYLFTADIGYVTFCLLGNIFPCEQIQGQISQ